MAGAGGLLLVLLVLGAESSTDLSEATPRHPALSTMSLGAPAGSASPPSPVHARDREPQTLAEQRTELLVLLERQRELSSDALQHVRSILEQSDVLGQGNPEITTHPLARDACRKELEELPVDGSALCGRRYMVPLYDPLGGEGPSDARVCIDQFEFPSVPCEFPVVHVTAKEAVELCEAVGKRICDAHEWEGACAGRLRPAADEYAFGQPRSTQRALHNSARERVWAYGSKVDHALCATGSRKTPGCGGGGFKSCGANSFPAGSFPRCVSRLGVYDLHGNVAEHMNLPLTAEELASRGGRGSTEMKGSWFTFAEFEAHEDDCRWRAPDWHGTRILDPKSHQNYHLGFRCCKDLPPADPSAAPTRGVR